MKPHYKQNPTLTLPVGKQISMLPILSLGILMTRLLASVSKMGYQAQASAYILLFVAYFCGINTQVQAQKAYIPNGNLNTVSVLNTATNTITATINVGDFPVGVSVSSDGSKCYVANNYANTVSVINTATNTVTATVSVGVDPNGIAVSPDGSKCYVTNFSSNTVAVINTATNTISATVGVGIYPLGVAVSPDGSKCYVANNGATTVSVINTATNTVSATVSVGSNPSHISFSPDGSKCYVANGGSNTVSVINTATNTISATVSVGGYPFGVAVSPNGSKCYVANQGSNTVSIINTATNTVTATVGVGSNATGIAVSPDGSKCYVANQGFVTVSVINTTTNTVTTINGFAGPTAFGNMFALYPPALSLSQTTLTGFNTTAISASASQTFTISGYNLTANASISVNTSDWELSTNNSTFSATLTLTQSSGALTGQPITVYVRLKSGLTVGSKTATLTASSTGATNQTITLTGNSISSTPSSVRGNAMSFNGVNNYVNSASNLGISGNSSRTLEMWFKVSNVSTVQVIACIGGQTLDGAFGLYLSNSALIFYGYGGNDFNTGATIAANTWYHAAITYDGTTVRPYVNGVLQTTNNNSLNTTNSTLRMGTSVDATPAYFFQGSLDEVRAWNVVRTQAQIRESMHLTLSGSETGLVAYYQFNETTGNAIDAISGNNGTLQNGTTRIESTVSVAKGFATRLTVPTGASTQTFGNATVTFTAMSAPATNDEFVTYQLYDRPLNNVSATSTASNYWIVRQFGTQTFSYNQMNFTLPTSNTISTTDVSTPANLKLFKRTTNSAGAWGTAIGTGTSANNTTKVIAYNISPAQTSFSEFAVASVTSPLPITLLGLKGERVEGLRGEMTEEVKLEWSTASEVNNKGFEVEMSTNGLAYQTIAFIEGAGQSHSTLNYQLSTLNPNDSYYRLKQIDFDGTFSYSPIVFVEGVVGKVIIYPNPNNGTFTVSVGKDKLDLPARLLNAVGKEVWQGVQTEVRTTGLPAGMYFLHTTVAGKTKVTKVVIER